MTTTTTAPAAVLNLQQTTESTEIELYSKMEQSSIDAMSYAELDEFINRGVNVLARNSVSISEARKTLVPAIQRIHDALCCQGRRTDLLDAPKQLTWDAWVKSKENLFGSRSTLYRLLAQAKIPKLLPVGVKVQDVGGGETGVVERTYTDEDGTPRVEVQFKNGEPKTTFSAENVRKVPTRKVSLGDSIIFTDMDGGYTYTYKGNCKFGPREKIQKSPKVTGFTGAGPWRPVVDIIQTQIAQLTKDGTPPATVRVKDQAGNPLLVITAGNPLTLIYGPVGDPSADMTALFLDANEETIVGRKISL